MNVFKAIGKGAAATGKAIGKGVARGLGFEMKGKPKVPGAEMLEIYDEMGESPQFQAAERMGLASDGDGDEVVVAEDPEFAAETGDYSGGDVDAMLEKLYIPSGPDANMAMEGNSNPLSPGVKRDTTKTLKGTGLAGRAGAVVSIPGAANLNPAVGGLIMQEKPTSLGVKDVLAPMGMNVPGAAMIMAEGAPTTLEGIPLEDALNTASGLREGAGMGLSTFVLPSALSAAGGFIGRMFGKGKDTASTALQLSKGKNPAGLSAQVAPRAKGGVPARQEIIDIDA